MYGTLGQSSRCDLLGGGKLDNGFPVDTQALSSASRTANASMRVVPGEFD